MEFLGKDVLLYLASFLNLRKVVSLSRVSHFLHTTLKHYIETTKASLFAIPTPVTSRDRFFHIIFLVEPQVKCITKWKDTFCESGGKGVYFYFSDYHDILYHIVRLKGPCSYFDLCVGRICSYEEEAVDTEDDGFIAFEESDNDDSKRITTRVSLYSRDWEEVEGRFISAQTIFNTGKAVVANFWTKY